MSPRKSSTSSANRLHRPRYLSLEVAGVTQPQPRELEQWLRCQLAPSGEVAGFRLVRFDGRRALVEVPHRLADSARAAWNRGMVLPDGRTISIVTRKTYGTLRKGKEWMRGRRSGPQRSRTV